MRTQNWMIIINELITDVSTLITESAETSNMLNKTRIKKDVGTRKRLYMTISHGTPTNVRSSERSILNVKTDIEI